MYVHSHVRVLCTREPTPVLPWVGCAGVRSCACRAWKRDRAADERPDLPGTERSLSYMQLAALLGHTGFIRRSRGAAVARSLFGFDMTSDGQ